MHTDELKDYLSGMIPSRNPLIIEMEDYARKHHVPIMDLIGIETLLCMLRLHKPKKILEIGTAIGYSAIRMASIDQQISIVTIERDRTRYEEALHNIENAKMQNQICVIFGDALDKVEEIKQQHGTFDCIFIDAAKGKYQDFFKLYGAMLCENGIIISDNVLFKGYVAKSNESIEPKRIRKLVNKIRDYNEFLMNHPHYTTTILPVGDGMAISVKNVIGKEIK